MRHYRSLLLFFITICLALPGRLQAQRKDIVLSKAGTLSQMVGDITQVTSLKVSGPVNGSDLRTIHEMCGMDFDHNTTQGKLDSLDLTDADIVKGGKSYYKNTETGESFYTQDNVLGRSGLEGCFSLTYVALPKTLQDVGIRAFASCPLKEICIDESDDWLTAIDGVLYTKDLTVMKGFPAERFKASDCFQAPEGLREIPEYCMMLGQMGEVDLPSTVETIGHQALFSCEQLSRVVLPAALKSLANDAFVSCGNLKEVKLDAGNANYAVKEGVLYNKQFTTLCLFPPALDLSSFEIPATVTDIWPYAFAFCRNLTAISLPESLTSIGVGAFGGCDKLQSMTVPANVTSLPDYTFANCGSLKSVTLPAGMLDLGAWCFDQCGQLSDVNIPDGITAFPDGLFCDCASLIQVHIPEGVTQVGSSVFYGCEALQSVDLPDKVNSIGAYAFMNCKSLNRITVPENVAEIPYSTFTLCSALEEVTLPSTLKRIDDFAFVGCEKLQTLRCFAVEPPACGNSVFYMVNDKADLYVPNEAVEFYKAASDWSAFHIVGVDATGLSSLHGIDEERSEYYNLNGTRLSSPNKGLTILRHGNSKGRIVLR